jgi:hypothetical protein
MKYKHKIINENFIDRSRLQTRLQSRDGFRLQSLRAHADVRERRTKTVIKIIFNIELL